MSILDMFGSKESKWEEYKQVAVYTNLPSLADWQRKIEEGWELIAIKDNKYYFRRMR